MVVAAAAAGHSLWSVLAQVEAEAGVGADGTVVAEVGHKVCMVLVAAASKMSSMA